MAKEFIATLEAMRDGDVVNELQAQLTDIVATVRATGKPGKLSLILTVKPMKNAEPHMLLIGSDIKVTLPKLDKSDTFMYATNENALTRRDPRQPELGFRETRLIGMPDRQAQ